MNEQLSKDLTGGRSIGGRVARRRGLLAGAAALAATATSLVAVQRTEAGHDTTTAPAANNVLHLGVSNDGGFPQNNDVSNITAPTSLIASVQEGITLRVRNMTTGVSPERPRSRGSASPVKASAG